MIKAVIFDMDGVVVLSKHGDFAAWKKIFEEIGSKLTHKIFTKFQGMRTVDIIKAYSKKTFTEQEIKSLGNKKQKYFLEYAKENGVEEIRGVTTLLRILKEKRYLIGLGTSAPRMKANFILKRLGLKKYFNEIVTVENIRNGKPNPEIFLKVASKLRCRPEECLVIEDAANGVLAAKKGGMKCLAITTTHSKNELKNADKVVNKFNQSTINYIENL